MNKSNSQNSILDRPVYISTHLKTHPDSPQTVGDERDTIITSLKRDGRTYEISITVKKGEKGCNLVDLVNNIDLDQQVKALAKGVFSDLSPMDGQEISSDIDGSITFNKHTQEGKEAREAAQAFKRAISPHLSSSAPVIAHEEASADATQLKSIPQGDSGITSGLTIKPLSDRQFPSDQPFKIFASKDARKTYFQDITEARLNAENASKSNRKDTLKVGLPQSQITRPDYRLSIQEPGKEIRKLLNLDKDADTATHLSSEHHLFYDSPYNHSGYINDKNEFVYIDNAVSSSSNRVSATPTMNRVVTDLDGSSIAYTGKPDTKEKAIMAIRHMIEAELKAGDKSKLIQNPDGTYTLPFLVNSLLTTSTLPLFKLVKDPTRTDLDYEKLMVEAESKIMEDLYNTIVTAPSLNGKDEIKVKVKPFFVNTSVNDFTYPMYGYEHSEKKSAFGNKAFKDYVQTQIKALSDKNPKEAEKKKQLEGALKALNNRDPELSLNSINKLINRAFICELLNIPPILHCKSSIDRTGMAIAIFSAMHQIIKSGDLDAFKEGDVYVPHSIMQHEEFGAAFKDLVALNVVVGNVFVEISRAKPGFKWGDTLIKHFITDRNRALFSAENKKLSLRKKAEPKFKTCFRALSALLERQFYAPSIEKTVEHIVAALPTEKDIRTQEASATKIQDLVRGHIARTRKAREEKEKEEEALIKTFNAFNSDPDQEISTIDPNEVKITEKNQAVSGSDKKKVLPKTELKLILDAINKTRI